MPSYFCHQCNSQRNVSEISNTNGVPTCRTCSSDFVEVIGNDSQDPYSAAAAAATTYNSFDLHSDPLMRPLFNFHQVQQPPPPQQQLQAEMFGTLPVFRFPMNMNRVIDMLEGGALDHVMTQLLSRVEGYGVGGVPPPATPQELARICKVTITAERVASGAQCSVCLDEFREGDTAERLPCEHDFHPQCIRPWLDKRATCPVCRKSLSAAAESPSGAAAAASGATGAAAADAADAEPELEMIGAVGGGGVAGAASSASLFGPFGGATAGPSGASRRRGQQDRDFVEDDCD